MKIFLFTGAAGYIGSHTAFCFLRSLEDCKIVIYDNLSTGFVENIHYLQELFGSRVEFIEGDMGDKQKLDSLMGAYNFYAVVHFAASLIVGESVSYPLKYYMNNTINTTQLINLCLKHKVFKFIFSSTAAVYGEPDSTLIPIVESTPSFPINPYGASKMMSERVLMDTHIAYPEFCYGILRYFNVAGASSANTVKILQSHKGLGQRSKNATHLIKVACECACGKRDRISVFGDDYNTPDGSCIRDYIHIDDLADAHLSTLEFLAKHNKSEIFNVGYGTGYSVFEVIQCLKEISGMDFAVTRAPRRAGDPAILFANTQKIRNLTQWTPKLDKLSTIIKSAWEWEKSL